MHLSHCKNVMHVLGETHVGNLPYQKSWSSVSPSLSSLISSSLSLQKRPTNIFQHWPKGHCTLSIPDVIFHDRSREEGKWQLLQALQQRKSKHCKCSFSVQVEKGKGRKSHYFWWGTDICTANAVGVYGDWRRSVATWSKTFSFNHHKGTVFIFAGGKKKVNCRGLGRQLTGSRSGWQSWAFP